MFVTYQEGSRIQRGNHRFNGATVSILRKEYLDFYWVGGHDSTGQWREWDAYIDELIGFEGVNGETTDE